MCALRTYLFLRLISGESRLIRPRGMHACNSTSTRGCLQEIDENEAREAVHEAFRLGINFFDTSPFYGNTKSETVLGKALVGLPRDQIVVATKVGRYGQDDFDFSPETIKERFQESLQRLQLSYVDVLQCHDIEFGDLGKVRLSCCCVCAPAGLRAQHACVCMLLVGSAQSPARPAKPKELTTQERSLAKRLNAVYSRPVQ